MKNILVIGGYGQVGSVICKTLSEIYPRKVIAAGRNFEKAKGFSLSMNDKVLPLKLDIYNLEVSHEVFTNTQLVIMCLDQKDTNFVEMCIQNQVHYIDISPSYNILSKIESLHSRALESGTTLLLGVGLAPGLTNLMVKNLVNQFNKVYSTDIYLMLGIGEKHGNDGVEWLLNNINSNYWICESDQNKYVSSFTDGKYVELPKKYGRRVAYRFNLADQHILTKTLDLENVSSRFFYDSVFTTKELAILKKLGAFKLLKYKFFKNILKNTFVGALHIFDKLKIGSNDYLIKAEVHGEIEGREGIVESVLFGSNNTEITGNVASILGNKLIQNNYAAGVHYMEQLFDLNDILQILDSEVSYTYETKLFEQ